MTAGPAIDDSTALGFSLTVPTSWFEVDVRPGRRDAGIRALVEARVREQPELWEQRTGIIRLLREQARRAFEAGAVYCACMVEPTDEGPITASVTVSLVAGPLTASSDDPDRVTPLLERLRPVEPSSPDDVWSRPGVTEIDGVGTCARSCGVEDLQLPDEAGWIRSVVMQTFVPVPDDRRVLLVTCSSPVLPLADELLDLFDAVTSTLRLVGA